MFRRLRAAALSVRLRLWAIPVIACGLPKPTTIEKSRDVGLSSGDIFRRVIATVISSKEDLQRYLEADRIALRRHGPWRPWRGFRDRIWAFQRSLRWAEYLANTKRSQLRLAIARYRLATRGRKLGFTIPINVFGPGLSIAHHGTIVVNGGAKVGANCRLHVCVNIGTAAGQSASAPTIGDNCYIGPGAKLFGPIIVGDNVVVGANAVVNKSFPEGNCTIGGIPARKISAKTSLALFAHNLQSAARSDFDAPGNEASPR